MAKPIDLSSLNAEQKAAVTAKIGPTLVLAGAGTGKTRVISYRAAHLIGGGAEPSSLLAVTFTNKAARELKERTLGLLKMKSGASAPRVGTIHSFCARLLREEAGAAGLSPEFTILDEGDRRALVERLAGEAGLDEKRWPARLILSLIEKAKMSGDGPDGVDPDLRDVYVGYREAVRRQGAVDFDDLLLKARDVLLNHPEAAGRARKKIRHALVDEFQDVNRAQFDILKLLVKGHDSLYAVGDDDQSIYGWRGAEPGAILRFRDHFSGAEIFRLEENYRCTPAILEAANAVISKNEERHKKTLWTRRRDLGPIELIEAEDERDEAKLVVQQVLEASSSRRPLGDFAILIRTNAQSRLFEEELRRASLRYILIGGVRFYDRAEVKTLLSYFRATVNPLDDQALTRVLNWPARGIGKGAAEKLREFARSTEAPLSGALKRVREVPGLTPRAVAAAERFAALMDRFAETLRGGGSLWKWALRLTEEAGFEAELLRTAKSADEGRRRWANVEETLESLAAYESEESGPTLTGFLENAALMNKEEETNEEPEAQALTLLTFHASKGLEFPEVFLTGLEEGGLPHERCASDGEIAEERRLFYVGITRAKDRLTLTRAAARSRFGTRFERKPSRFLEDVPAKLLDRMEFEALRAARAEIRDRSARSYLQKMSALLDS